MGQQQFWALVLVLVAGSCVAVQAPVNGMLGRAVQSPVNAGLVSFIVGGLVLLAFALLLRVPPDPAAVKALPWYAWIGGALGAFYVATAAYAAPRIGITLLMATAIAGQLAVALALDKFGAFGMPKQDISLNRLLAVALVFGGVLLARS